MKKLAILLVTLVGLALPAVANADAYGQYYLDNYNSADAVRATFNLTTDTLANSGSSQRSNFLQVSMQNGSSYLFIGLLRTPATGSGYFGCFNNTGGDIYAAAQVVYPDGSSRCNIFINAGKVALDNNIGVTIGQGPGGVVSTYVSGSLQAWSPSMPTWTNNKSVPAIEYYMDCNTSTTCSESQMDSDGVNIDAHNNKGGSFNPFQMTADILGGSTNWNTVNLVGTYNQEVGDLDTIQWNSTGNNQNQRWCINNC